MCHLLVVNMLALSAKNDVFTMALTETKLERRREEKRREEKVHLSLSFASSFFLSSPFFFLFSGHHVSDES